MHVAVSSLSPVSIQIWKASEDGELLEESALEHTAHPRSQLYCSHLPNHRSHPASTHGWTGRGMRAVEPCPALRRGTSWHPLRHGRAWRMLSSVKGISPTRAKAVGPQRAKGHRGVAPQRQKPDAGRQGQRSAGERRGAQGSLCFHGDRGLELHVLEKGSRDGGTVVGITL